MLKKINETTKFLWMIYKEKIAADREKSAIGYIMLA